MKSGYKNVFYICLEGETRATLKWADGKAIKNEVDMQVFNICHFNLPALSYFN